MEPYQEEPERFSWETTIAGVTEGKFVTLEKSYFYPQGGGQPHDEGTLTTAEGVEYPVLFVGKFDGTVSHQVDPDGRPPLEPGMTVLCTIDEERRRQLMRSHTAAHIVSAVIHNKTGALITGNQLATDKVRIDFSLPEFDPEAFAQYIEDANAIIDQGTEVLSREVHRDDLSEDDAVFKLAKGFPEHIKRLRILEIPGVDVQACGGTHVSDTRHIGRLELVKVENKGAKNRRVYFRLLSPSATGSP